MERNRERGEGRFGTVIALLVVAAAGYCAWNAGPAYLANFELKDKLVEVARMPRGTNTDDKLLDALERYIREEQLTPYINRSNFRINTRETARTVSLSYERRVRFLPGWERTVKFEQIVEQPLLF